MSHQVISNPVHDFQPLGQQVNPLQLSRYSAMVQNATGARSLLSRSFVNE